MSITIVHDRAALLKVKELPKDQLEWCLLDLMNHGVTGYEPGTTYDGKRGLVRIEPSRVAAIVGG